MVASLPLKWRNSSHLGHRRYEKCDLSKCSRRLWTSTHRRDEGPKGVFGSKLAPVFLVNIGLPNRVAIPELPVTLGELTGADVLIGMDIIGQGDFAVTHSTGRPSFRFACRPSDIDFVKEGRLARLSAVRARHKSRGKKSAEAQEKEELAVGRIIRRVLKNLRWLSIKFKREVLRNPWPTQAK